MSPTIFAHSQGGLCNRLQCIDSSYLVAQELGANLTIAWLRNDALNAKFSELFSTRDLPDTVSVLELDTREELDAHRQSFNATHEFTPAFFTLDNFKPEFWRQLNHDVHSRIWIQGWMRFHTDAANSSIFLPNPEVQTLIDAFSPLALDAVGVHIRRTDNNGAISRSATPAFFDYLAQNFHGERYFLCTEVVGIQDAVVDLSLLTKTKFIVGSIGSTFSASAAYYGQRPLHRVRRRACTARSSLTRRPVSSE